LYYSRHPLAPQVLHVLAHRDTETTGSLHTSYPDCFNRKQLWLSWQLAATESI